MPKNQGSPKPTNVELAVERIETKVDGIQAQIGRVTRVAEQARDGVIRLTQSSEDLTRRVDSIEQLPDPTHELCDEVKEEKRLREKHDEESRRAGQERAKSDTERDTKITALEIQQAGLSKWRWYVATISVTIGLTAAGIAGKALWNSGVTEGRQESLRRDVTEVKSNHNDLVKRVDAGNQQVVKAINDMPGKVLEAMPQTSVSQDDPNLTRREREMIRLILKRAADRGEDDG